MRPAWSVLLFVMSGCYGLQPVDPASPPGPGTIVEAELTPIRSRVIRGSRTEVEEVPGERFRGEIIAVTGDSLFLSTWNTDLGTPRQAVHIPLSAVLELDLVTFSPTRTVLVAAGAVVAGALMWTQIRSVTGAPPGSGPGPDDGGFRIPLWARIPWP